MKSYEEINVAQELSDDLFTEERYKRFFHNFPTHVKSVLDVGCNMGWGGRVLKQLNQSFEIVGLDCLESCLDKVPKFIYERTVCGYSTSIPSRDSSFDVVVAGEFIEHLYPDDVTQTLKEFYRVIKPKGRLLLTTPNPNYILLKLTRGSVLSGAHVSQHYPANLKKELEEVGFMNVEIRGSGKVSRIMGENFPLLAIYGSYLTIADKTA